MHVDRRLSVALTTTLLVVVSSFTTPAYLVGADSDEVQSSPRLDQDRNRIHDDLDALLLEADDANEFRVIIRMLDPSAHSVIADLKSAVGDFDVLTSRGKTHPDGTFWTFTPAFGADLTKSQILSLADRADIQHLANGAVAAKLAMNTSREATGVNVALHPDILGLDGSMDDDNATAGPYVFTEDDVVVCVVDTGIDRLHPAFAADDPNSGYSDLYTKNPPDPYDVWWKDFSATPATQPEDVRGHGTNMASIIAGHDRRNMTNSSNPTTAPYLGVAPGAALAVVRGAIVGEELLDLGTLINGVEWCAGVFDGDEGPDFVDIISGSWGLDTTDCQADQPVLSEVVEDAVASGIIAVFAAGNDGPRECSIHEPSILDEVISVGMVSDPMNPSCGNDGFTSGGGWYLNPHSSRGSNSDPVLKPDILAPGVCITSAVYNIPPAPRPETPYQNGSGTSPATAFVAGVIALMLDITGKKANATGGLSPADVKQILIDTAIAPSWGPDDDIGGRAGQDAEFGAGVINARAAITKACTTVFTDATNRTNICKTNATGVAQSPNEDPPQPTHESRTETLADLPTPPVAPYDNWTLSITDTDWPISITLIVPGWPTDEFTLALYDPSGVELQATSAARHSAITPVYPTSNGDYTIVVTNAATSGGTYWLDVSAGGTMAANPNPDG